MIDLVLQGGPLPTHLIDALVNLTGASETIPRPPGALRLRDVRRHPEVATLCAREKRDFAYVPSGLRLADFGLLAMDMDSTLITIECIDEVADFAGKKSEVAAITEAAMRGRLDFGESLRQRAALLAGLPQETLQRVYDERLRLSPGAETLIAAAHAAGLKTLLVSGGFSYFTERLQRQLKLDATASNTLEVIDGKLTGRVHGDIVDARSKAAHVAAMRERTGLTRDQVITIGDGANDLLMMAESSLSIAYHAKPVARAEASVVIDHVGLDGVLALFE